MIHKQSTPMGDNPFYQYELRQRAFGRRYSQLAMIVHNLRIKPEVSITVLYPHREACDHFIQFAEANGVIFKTGDIEEYGSGAVQQTIYSYEVKL